MALTAMGALVYTPRVPEQPELEKNQSIKDVRNRLAPIIEAVRYFDRVTFMTNRNVRVAAIVPVPIGELIDEVGGPDKLIALVRAGQQAQGK
jgi:antitoxin (DNA-binding transcriptional repressor) of toxin-antitoxin stability system